MNPITSKMVSEWTGRHVTTAPKIQRWPFDCLLRPIVTVIEQQIFFKNSIAFRARYEEFIHLWRPPGTDRG